MITMQNYAQNDYTIHHEANWFYTILQLKFNIGYFNPTQRRIVFNL